MQLRDDIHCGSESAEDQDGTDEILLLLDRKVDTTASAEDEGRSCKTSQHSQGWAEGDRGQLTVIKGCAKPYHAEDLAAKPGV